jgi:hypothetical protein
VQGNFKELKTFLGDNKARYTTYHTLNDIFDSADLIQYGEYTTVPPLKEGKSY